MAAAKPRRKAAKGHKLPEPISEGFEITDTKKNVWIIGKKIGSGGFGTVYFGSNSKNRKDFDYVIKIEYHENGPLFAEMHCYQIIAKPEKIADYVKKRKLDYLGLSPCHGFGSFEFNGSKYRFMVLERYDCDLQTLLDENGNKFPLKTVCLIGLSVLNVLEYIHNEGYIHGDIKAANLLIGRKKGTQNQVYLVDMGLACKYQRNGVHKEDLPDPKKAHNGTPEFTSRDAHRGSFSRRSDLEMLCYNLLQWLCRQLPWEQYISDNNKLQKEKEKYMGDIDDFLKKLFPRGKCPDGVAELLGYVCNLEFKEEPDYNYCRNVLKDELKALGYANNSVLEFKKFSKDTGSSSKMTVPQCSDKENSSKVAKKPQQTKRKELNFEPGTVLTPAMLEVLNKRDDMKSKSRKKK